MLIPGAHATGGEQVPDKEQAAIFYGEGLGLSADPGSTAAQRGGVGVTWFNIGRQQVLLPCRLPSMQSRMGAVLSGQAASKSAALAAPAHGPGRYSTNLFP